MASSGVSGEATGSNAGAPVGEVPGDGQAVESSAIPEIPFDVVGSYPHDPNAWTQGLAYAGPDRLFEGTGDYENSSLREVALSTGEVLRAIPLPSPQMYGEGITVVDDAILQLTWRDGVGLVWRASDFTSLGQFLYPAAGTSVPQEGWGITADGSNLYVSDGTEFVYVADVRSTLDTGELAVTKVLTVRWAGTPIDRLNELEYVDGRIYANVWQTDTIVRFDAGTGTVDGQLDIAGLLAAGDRAQADTPNGIAYDPTTGDLLVTGKRWPLVFALRLG